MMALDATLGVARGLVDRQLLFEITLEAGVFASFISIRVLSLAPREIL
ncbi:hypothetical protein [Bosea sp. Tri-44]|nr:hypothetical protein [Bosea sp. Tri-44]